MESNPPSDPSDLPTQTKGECGIEDDTHRILKLLGDDVDRFIASLSSIPDKPNSRAPRITASAETYVDMVEADLERADSSLLAAKSALVDSMARLGELRSLLNQFLPGENTTQWLSKMSLVLQKAMMLLEDELRNILEEFVSSSSSSSMSCALSPSSSDKTPKTMKHFSSLHSHIHRRQDSEPGSNRSSSVSELESYPVEEDDFPAIPGETVVQMRVIAAAMIASGYENECCQVYSVLRRNAFKSALKNRGFRKLSIDEVGKMSWEQLEPQVTTWNKVVRHTARILYPREYTLCSEVFSDHPLICEGIMTNLVRAVAILFLNFAEGIGMTKRAAERLFKVIEIYQSLMELESAIQMWKLPHETKSELRSEISSVQRRLGEAAVAIFSDLEDSITNDPTKNIVPGGGIHPLTRYAMNYIRCACDFKDILETIFQNTSSDGGDKATKTKSAFSMELSRILWLLDTKLEAKSKQYKDASLSCVFLMNNGRYILQRIKEAPEVNELVGRVVGRKRSTELRAHHKSYQRETWSKVLQCLNHEGLQVHGKVHKPILKERFKSFNQMLDEIHKTQSSWVVSDEQLQSELRVSVSSVMIPAYRSFVARFGQYFTPGRQVEKYIKYQPEDIEATIDDLFDGNPNLPGKSKKGAF